MKISILFSLVISCLLPAAVQAQNWVEYKRTDANNKPIAYTDTIYIYHLQKDSISLRLNGFQYNNPIRNHKTDLTFTSFEVLAHGKEEIILEKRSGTKHYFHFREKKNQAVLVQAVDDIAARVKRQDKTPITITSAWLQKNWKAYKRESVTGPIANLDFKTVIKRVTLKEASDSLLGFMKLGSESTYLFRVIKVEQGHFLVADPQGKQYQFHIYGLTERELVFEDHRGLVYYCIPE